MSTDAISWINLVLGWISSSQYDEDAAIVALDHAKNAVVDLEAKLAACEWKPITETDLPKVGEHEIGFFVGSEWLVSACRQAHKFAHYCNGGGTHFRPINPPQQGKP